MNVSKNPATQRSFCPAVEQSEDGEECDDAPPALHGARKGAARDFLCGDSSSVAQTNGKERTETRCGSHAPEETADACMLNHELHCEGRDGRTCTPGKVQQSEHGGTPLRVSIAGEHAVRRHRQAQTGAEQQEQEEKPAAPTKGEPGHAGEPLHGFRERHADGGSSEDGEQQTAGASIVQMPEGCECRKAAAQQREADAGYQLHTLNAEDGSERITNDRAGWGQAGFHDGSRVDSRAMSVGSTATWSPYSC